MAITLRVVVPPHPLIAHWLTVLRGSNTPNALYSTAFEELGKWLTYEALRDWLPYKSEEIETQTSKTIGKIIESSVSLIAIPIDGAGFELWHGARNVLPNAHLSIGGIPSQIEQNTGLIIFIGQISDGENLLEILDSLKEKKIEQKKIRVVSALTCSEGLTKLGAAHKDLSIYCACIDQRLVSKDLIDPGIGNPSLRLNTRINVND